MGFFPTKYLLSASPLPGDASTAHTRSSPTEQTQLQGTDPTKSHHVPSYHDTWLAFFCLYRAAGSVIKRFPWSQGARQRLFPSLCAFQAARVMVSAVPVQHIRVHDLTHRFVLDRLLPAWSSRKRRRRGGESTDQQLWQPLGRDRWFL